MDYQTLAAENAKHKDKIIQLIKENKIGQVVIYFVDLNNIARGKILDKEYFLSVMDKGCGFDYYILTQSITGEMMDVPGIIPEVSGDMLAIPDLSNFVIFSPIPNQAIVLADLYWKNLTPILFAPRNKLKETLDLYKSRGLFPKAGIELEFSLAKNGCSKSDINRPYSIQSQIEFNDLFEEIQTHAKQVGIPIEAVISEFDEWQFEIVTKYDCALRSADNLVLLKHLVRVVSKKHGYDAIFAAKPSLNQAGNGLHFHISLWNKENEFCSSQGISPMLSYFIAGNLRHMRDCALIYLPCTNSYSRLQKNSQAPTTITWGYDNRSVALRVLDTYKQSARVENRIAGSDSNIYLIFSASLLCGLIGIDHQYDLPPARLDHTYNLDGLETLPLKMEDALDSFCRDPKLSKIMGDIVTLFSTIKRKEIDSCKNLSFEQMVKLVE